jgi:AraC family ethanolamine operon transcriptional activator
MGRVWASDRPFSYHSTIIDGIDELRRPVDGAEARVVQLGRGRLTGRLTRARVGDVAFSKGTFSLPVCASGVLSETRLTIGAILECTSPLKALSGSAIRGDIFVIPPGLDHQAVYNGPTSFAGLSVDSIELALLFGAEGPLSEPDYWARRRHCRPRLANTATVIDRRLRLIFERLAKPFPLSETTIDYFGRSVVEAFVEPIVNTNQFETFTTIPSTITTIREVERYVEARQHRSVHISELCSHLRISRRTLHRCFDDVLGIGPAAFLRHKRLCAVHSALRRLDPEITRVTDVATEFGFLELGRFSQHYRLLFGEYPHETLRR